MCVCWGHRRERPPRRHGNTRTVRLHGRLLHRRRVGQELRNCSASLPTYLLVASCGRRLGLPAVGKACGGRRRPPSLETVTKVPSGSTIHWEKRRGGGAGRSARRGTRRRSARGRAMTRPGRSDDGRSDHGTIIGAPGRPLPMSDYSVPLLASVAMPCEIANAKMKDRMYSRCR